jgi:ribosomal protein S3AE
MIHHFAFTSRNRIKQQQRIVGGGDSDIERIDIVIAVDGFERRVAVVECSLVAAQLERRRREARREMKGTQREPQQTCEFVPCLRPLNLGEAIETIETQSRSKIALWRIEIRF